MQRAASPPIRRQPRTPQRRRRAATPAAQGISRRPMSRLARGHLAGRPPPSNAAASARAIPKGTPRRGWGGRYRRRRTSLAGSSLSFRADLAGPRREAARNRTSSAPGPEGLITPGLPRDGTPSRKLRVNPGRSPGVKTRGNPCKQAKLRAGERLNRTQEVAGSSPASSIARSQTDRSSQQAVDPPAHVAVGDVAATDDEPE